MHCSKRGGENAATQHALRLDDAADPLRPEEAEALRLSCIALITRCGASAETSRI
jgi:hypothetical protein